MSTLWIDGTGNATNVFFITNIGRCVWRFCVAESTGDLKLLSAKEQIAQKIMRKVYDIPRYHCRY